VDRVYLGIDGGGSKTEALVIDETGRVLHTGRSGRANYQTCGLEMAMDHVREAALEALHGRQAISAAYCLAGADTRADYAILEPAVRALELGQEIVLYNDVIAIFRAGSRYPYGMAVVCGTGFNAGGISRDGREVRLPSLGTMTGDIGGGGWLGTSALGAAFRAWDGRGASTLLQDMVLRALNVDDMETLAERIVLNQITYQHTLELAPLVFKAAVAGDEVACQLLRQQGEEIGITILAILRRLDLLDTDCDVVLGGSVFYGEGPLLMDTVRKYIEPAAPLAVLKRLSVRPVVGAALLAADHAGVTTEEFLSNLHNSLPKTLKLST